MANKSNNTKNIVIGICVAVVAIILIVVIVVLATRKGGFGGLNDSYFVSDNTKLVLDMGSDALSSSDEEYPPKNVRLVYTYSGDQITGLSAYYEYEDEATAKSAYDYLAKNMEGEYKSISRDGVYVIMEADESEYSGVTVDDVKQQIEFMEMIKNMNIDEEENEDGEVDTENIDSSSEEVDSGENAEAETEVE